MKITQFEVNSTDLSNCYMLEDEETGSVAIIDPCWFLPQFSNIYEDKSKKIECILLTHGHFDHLLGLSELKELCGAKIYIGEADAPCLASRQANLMDIFNVTESFTPCKADVLLKDGAEIPLGNSVIKVMAAPGHSEGGLIFIDEKDRILISGDTLFYSTVGRTDMPGGSDAKLRDTISRLLQLEGDYDIYPGHGPATKLSRERTRNIYIRRMNR